MAHRKGMFRLAVLGVTVLIFLIFARGLAADAPPPGVTSWWPGDVNANDVVDGHNGVMVGTASLVPGKVGQAFSVNPPQLAAGYVDLGDWSAGSQWSIEAWVNPFNVNSGGGLAIVGGLDQCKDWALVLQNYELALAVRPPGVPPGCTAAISSHVVPTPGVWHHVVGTNNGTTARIYVNGILRESGPVDPGYVGIDTGAFIGRQTWFGDQGGFHGLVDEVRIYGRALSDAEIAALYSPPTSVTLAGFEAVSGAGGWPVAAVAGGLAACLGGAALWRRRRAPQ